MTGSAVSVPRGASPSALVLRRLLRSQGAIVGAIALLGLVSIAVLAPSLAPRNPIGVLPLEQFRPPSLEHLFGTDVFGRDIFSRTLYGARYSLTMGLASVGVAATLGSLAGLVAGYYGGRVSLLIMRATDVMLAFPGMLLALVVVTILGPGLTNVMLAVGIANIPAYVRIVRGSTLAARTVLYVEAARAVGAPTSRVMFRHIFPNVTAPIIVLSTLGLAGAILTGAGLSFLGLGAQPPTPEWGTMLSDGRAFLRRAWWISTFPGLAIMVSVLAINMLGDGLRDALDPRLRE
ncbi:MAG: ABC transporter permease [Armatimonadota bacterium]